mmetsp:Transcript_27419/g.76893  ORF Transcript_27419/g.76893 Transcript_27419/m.76893 type:complete len:641 (-) Transcript_27419:114-2036(-)|eukprot:CAMPEP_0119568776 /NCGR_PEP_ID=MMETSP1352-20130426/39746_1 /TAXON_ID=265584 /ORGANISM="Stauroneis constricta, Strain CCMP1120" /LENGTH=640 /DNA_ID=CAMNT_0007618225 /DNA_START=85 /DNA_END=2007 /DNA_ORIENTATION=+
MTMMYSCNQPLHFQTVAMDNQQQQRFQHQQHHHQIMQPQQPQHQHQHHQALHRDCVVAQQQQQPQQHQPVNPLFLRQTQTQPQHCGNVNTNELVEPIIMIDDQQPQQQPPQQQPQEQRFQWPPHIAKNMSDQIHGQVTEMLAGSRLDCRTDSIQLVHREDICHVERVLGSGAFSHVTAVQTRDGGKYACKHLQPSLMNSPDNFRVAAAELACEAHMLASFDHPNILKIRGWAQNGIASFEDGRHDSFFLLLDRLEESLEQRIPRWNMEEERLMRFVGNVPPALQMPSIDRSSLSELWHRVTSFAAPASSFPPVNDQQIAISIQYQSIYLDKLRVISEVACALEYLHNQGVIFRDLKPANIGFLPCGKIQLFDFGLSRELPALDTSVPFEMSGKVGTLRYMAPEVALHQDYNVSADVYSWAMVSYEVLTGEKPFNGWTREMHADLVCSRGMRPDLHGKNMLYVRQQQQQQQHFSNNNSNCGSNGNVVASMGVVLENAWSCPAQQRPSMGELYAQLLCMHDQQVLVLEEQQFQQRLAELQAQELLQQQQQREQEQRLAEEQQRIAEEEQQFRQQQQQQRMTQQQQHQQRMAQQATTTRMYIEIPAPDKGDALRSRRRRSNSLDSIGTIETSSLSADSIDFFF